jgi:cytochrome c peroxidase
VREIVKNHRWELIVAAIGIGCGLVACGGGGGGGSSSTTVVSGNPLPVLPSKITTKAQLGQAFFFDTTLSNPKGMSCATCHDPNHDFRDPRPGFPTSQGAVKGLFGFRNSPSIKYMAYSPEFDPGNPSAGGARGGQFWDGHATDLANQAHFPMLNPIEMGNASAAAIIASVQAGPYASALKSLYGATIFSNTTNALAAVTDAIATFEKIPQVSPFTSKYDAFLKGEVQLTASETRGLTLFNGKGNCSGCHTSSPLPDGTPPLFTNFCYANLGLPKNPKNPYYSIPKQFNPQGSSFIDLGLEGTTGRSSDAGNFMTPPLRNVAVTGPYFHNGVFTTLAQVVHFYNTRDLGGFAPAEVPATMDTIELGNLGLSPQDEADIVAFLGTLTDGYTPAKP